MTLCDDMKAFQEPCHILQSSVQAVVAFKNPSPRQLGRCRIYPVGLRACGHALGGLQR